MVFGNWKWYSETGEWYSETGIYWPAGMAFLISHEVKLKFRSYATYWEEEVAGLAPEEDDMEAQILCNVFAGGGGGF